MSAPLLAAIAPGSPAARVGLAEGLRRSLSLEDDDRLSFLDGNFTTLPRYTEAELVGDGRPVADRNGDRGVFVGSAERGCGDVSGSTGDDERCRAPRATSDQLLWIGHRRDAPVAILTEPYGACVLGPLLERLAPGGDVRIVTSTTGSSAATWRCRG